MENFKDVLFDVLVRVISSHSNNLIYVRAKTILSELVNKYSEPHRYYHVWSHLEYMYDIAIKLNIELTDKLVLGIAFHDAIYDPKCNDNEIKSAEYFYSIIPDDAVKIAILETEDHKPKSELGKVLCKLDLYNLYDDFNVFYENSYLIFKEYQFVDLPIYLNGRHDVLVKYNVNPEWIKAVDAFKPKIGIYAGSFNPYHAGHQDIVKKAEQIFDKVIIVRAINKDKKIEFVPLPEHLKYHQCEFFDGDMLTDYIKSLDYNVTLIRGLRNSSDFESEHLTLQYWRDFMPEIQVVYLMSDLSLEKISSSAIRMLGKNGERYL